MFVAVDSRFARSSVLATLVFSIAAIPSLTLANSGGIPGFSGKATAFCSQCHGGGRVPMVTLQGPANLEVGATGRFTLTVRTSQRNQQTAAGAGIAASGGTLAPVTGLKVFNGELVHAGGARDNDAEDKAVFEFDWTAPLAAGSHTIFAAGNSVNLNFLSSGDAAAKTSLQVMVSMSSSPTPTPTPRASTPTGTATHTATVTPSLTSTLAPSATPTATVPTSTATPTSTASATPTPTRAVTPGDSNCNNRITAADLLPVVELAIECQAECEVDSSLCGVDVNGDRAIDILDIEALIAKLFSF